MRRLPSRNATTPGKCGPGGGPEGYDGPSLPRAAPIAEPVVLRVERSPGPGAKMRVEREPSLLVPLDQSVVMLDLRGAAPARLDRACVALVPAATAYRVCAKSTVATHATLVIGPAPREAACREYAPHVDRRRFAELLATAHVLPRTRWIDEIVARYLFERQTCGKHGSAAAVFLETEIAKELYFLTSERAARRTRASLVREEIELVARARAFIDGGPLAPLRVAELARRCGASESTLLRAFRRELGTTPAAYAREHRLDAALLLLQDGRHTVGQVAAQVGYSALSAFTSAFRRRHDRAPSSLLRARADGTVEPLRPDGGPLRRKRASD